MKMFRVLLAVVFIVCMSMSIGYAQGFSADNKPTPIFCDNGSQGVVTCANTAGTVATAFIANPARLDGYVLNASTAYLKCSLSGGTTTLIDAAYYLLYPSGDAYSRDRMWLKHESNVYRGALYFYGIEVDLSTKSGAGKTSMYEWK